MSSQVEELLHQIHEFVTDFTQTKVSKSEFSFFLACLRASLAKSYEFLLFSHRDTESEGYFFAVSTLRGITEDLIVLKFISQLDCTKRERLLQGLQLIEVHERVTRQQAFFEKYRPFQPVLGWTDNDTYQESCPLGVLELRTSMHLTSICTLGSSWSWNVRHLIVVYSGG